MSLYDAVPELDGQVFLTDTGIETDLIFHQGIDLPLFAAFVLADEPAGRAALERWHRDHAAAATDHGLGVSLDAATWRASSDWGDQLGYDAAALDRVNRDLVGLLHDDPGRARTETTPFGSAALSGRAVTATSPTLLMSARGGRRLPPTADRAASSRPAPTGSAR